MEITMGCEEQEAFFFLEFTSIPSSTQKKDSYTVANKEDSSLVGCFDGDIFAEKYGNGGKERGGEINGKNKMDANLSVRKRQKELCRVCGDFSSGYHYTALTCEGCKGFFRRSVSKNAVYHCKFGNRCDIDMYMRRKCQKCRLEKCLNVGMRPENVMPLNRLSAKGKVTKPRASTRRLGHISLNSLTAEASVKKKMKGLKTSLLFSSGSTTFGSEETHHYNELESIIKFLEMYQHDKERKPTATAQDISASLMDQPDNSSSLHGINLDNDCSSNLSKIIKSLSRKQGELITRLVYLQKEFERPSEENLRKISQLGTQASESDATFKHITEMEILIVLLIVEFSKRLPGFNTLLREDKIILLKACSSEVMMFRSAQCYDVHTDSVIFTDNLPYTRDSYKLAGLGDLVGPLFRLGKTISTMRLDSAEYALLTAIVIFSDRSGLVEAQKVEKIQDTYLEMLQAYVKQSSRPMTELAKLSSVLTDLRTLSNVNSYVCSSLKSKNKKLPPFLEDIWDVHS